MLFLRLQVGADDYLLDARQVVEVLPLVTLKRIPQAPTGVAGVFNFRGTPVPVLDLSQLVLDRPAEQRMSTRMILVYHTNSAGVRHVLGLIAEKATETIQREAGDFTAAGVASTAAPWLGPVTQDAGRLLQCIELDKLLPASVSEVLFQPQEDA